MPLRTECDPGAHVDCFGGPAYCVDGEVRVPISAPIPFCSHEDAQQAYWSGICSRRFQAIPCPGRRCAARVDPRFGACGAQARDGWERSLCEGAVPVEGAPCAYDANCYPSLLTDGTRLRCDTDAGATDAGVCRRAPRTLDGPPLVPCRFEEDCPLGHSCRRGASCVGTCVADPRDASVDGND